MPRRVKRVVLGIGHPWFTSDNSGPLVSRSATTIKLMQYDGQGKTIALEIGELGGYNKIRLVAEIIE